MMVGKGVSTCTPTRTGTSVRCSNNCHFGWIEHQAWTRRCEKPQLVQTCQLISLSPVAVVGAFTARRSNISASCTRRVAPVCALNRQTNSSPYQPPSTRSLLNTEASAFRSSIVHAATQLGEEQHDVTSNISTIDVVSPAAPATASLSRVVLTSVQQPARAARVTPGGGGSRGFGLSGTSSLVLIVLSITAAVAAGVRSKLKAVRECAACRGFGVQRCKLCSGKGGIEWEGKMAHREPCPLCLGRRYIRCNCCGGGPFARNVFMHKNKTGEALLQQLQQFNAPGAAKQPRRWLFGRLSTTSAQEDNIEKSDELAEQIMMD